MLVVTFNVMVMLYISVIIGFICSKLKVFNDEARNTFATLLLQVTIPCLILSSTNIVFNNDIFTNSILAILIGFVLHIIGLLLGYICVKYLNINISLKKLYVFAITFGNVAYMGYPIALALYGQIGLFYAIMINVSFNLLVYSLGRIIMINSEDKQISFAKTLINPALIATILGVINFALPYNIPETINNGLDMVGKMTTPIAMLIVGMYLSDMKIKDIVTSKYVYFVSLIRLIVIPVLMYIILIPFNLDPILFKSSIVISATPAAVVTVIYANQNNNNPDEASRIVFITTLISVISIPLIAILIN